MRVRLILLSLMGSGLLVSTIFFLKRASHWDQDAFYDEVRVIPEAESYYGPPGVEYLEKQVGRKLNVDEAQAFGRSVQEEWRRFEDDLVVFELPKDSLINVDVVTPEKAASLRIVGGVVGTTDNRFERAYQITVGTDRLPYGILLLSQADWLDEGICFCGPIALKRLVVRDGILFEFSLLPSGKIKKVQALSGDGLRATLFEWTHSAISQDTYSRIADSIRLKSAVLPTREEWMVKSKEFREGIQLCGWVSHGDATQDIERILGKPSLAGPKSLVYSVVDRSADGSGWETTLRFPMKNGRFTGFRKQWHENTELEPVEGSSSWALAIANSEDIGEPLVEAVFDAFLKNSREAESRIWNSWCQAVSKLHEKGFEDERVLSVVRDRFTDPKLESHYAAWVLHKYESVDREELFVARLKLSLDQSGEPSPSLGDLWNLFSFLDAEHSEYDDLVRRALSHSDLGIQARGLRYAHHLPESEAREVAREKSKSDDSHVRSMTEGLYRRIARKVDLDELQAWLDRETDEDIKEDLQSLIMQIERY